MKRAIPSDMDTLVDFFDRHVSGSAVALIHDDGFRRWPYTHDDVRRLAEAFASRLRDAGVQPGERMAIWSENRPEWVVAFWGCILRGVAVVPIDERASIALAKRLVAASDPRGVLVGERVPSGEWQPPVFVWPLRDLGRAGCRALPSPRVAVTPDTVAEIVFTSGTTGDPKGVLIRHRNILANITAIEPEARKYAPYLLPLRPLRFLSLLPLSHMFGQALTMFLPPLVRAGAVFVRGYNPDEIVRQIRRHRITLVVTVPRVLEMLRGQVRHLAPSCANPQPSGSLTRRLWRYRSAHRLFWWRFCGFVVGGAQLDEDLEAFWRRLGFAVIRGYGLTETAPIIAWNHPFKMRQGTVGTPLGDAEIRIAADGEILVRGSAVTTGYFNAPEKTREAFEGGWFHTGDIGSFDDTGHLRIRGRTKDVIVPTEGVKVFPEDVERVLDAAPGVREAAVVGRRVNGGERVHAVLVVARGTEPAAVVHDANAKLESDQRIQEWSVWPDATLPRTEAIRKLKHHEPPDRPCSSPDAAHQPRRRPPRRRRRGSAPRRRTPHVRRGCRQGQVPERQGLRCTDRRLEKQQRHSQQRQSCRQRTSHQAPWNVAPAAVFSRRRSVRRFNPWRPSSAAPGSSGGPSG